MVAARKEAGRLRYYWGNMLLAALLCGCQANFETIPTGRWEGEGQWSSCEKNQQGRLEQKEGKYTTAVIIAKRRLAGQDMFAVTVLSKHPPDSKFSPKYIHLIVTLAKSNQSAEGYILCDTHGDLDTQTRPSLEEPSEADLKKVLAANPSPPAKLSRRGWLTILQMQYAPLDQTGRSPFAESFTFEGNRLVKRGYLESKENNGSPIRWTENLRKVE